MPVSPVTSRPTDFPKSTDPFSWKNYFLTCWAATHHNNVARYLPSSHLPVFRVLVLYKVRFMRLLERCIFPNRKCKALLKGIRAEEDSETVTVKGPHSDVAAMKRLLINPKTFLSLLPPRVLAIARSLFLLKAYAEVRFVPLFGRWIFPNRKRKALLIGIEGEQDPNTVTLKGPHDDVTAMKGLLIEIYGYKEEDITVMLDGANSEMEPTRESILREIDNLVRDARCGDRFVFHFCGHSIQVPNRSGTEDDGLDEAIMPSDNEHIIDNILRQRLVDPLPVGSNLVAIFDTCHSASMLDLEHHRCNRIYIPWVFQFKPTRRIHEHRVRRAHSTAYSRYARFSESSTDTPPSTPASPTSGKRTQTCKTVLRVESPKHTANPTRALTRVSVITHLADTPGSDMPKKSAMATEMQIHRECELVSELGADGDVGGLDTIREVSEGAEQREKEGSVDILGPEFQRSSSPAPLVTCDGFELCEHQVDKQMAHVISLGASKDGQATWEQEGGKSMTATLVKILEHTPHLSLKFLMLEISEPAMEIITKMHQAWLDHQKVEREHAKLSPLTNVGGGDEEREPDYLKEWQNPQLASHKKLDMDMPFTL